jgi:hypothetical protein
MEGEMRCPEAGTYLDTTHESVAKSWRDKDLVEVSPSGQMFAQSNVHWYVIIYRSANKDTPLVHAIGAQPVASFFEAENAVEQIVFRSLAWSPDGSSLYVLMANASVMLMRNVGTGSSTIIRQWSPVPDSSLTMDNPCKLEHSR